MQKSADLTIVLEWESVFSGGVIRHRDALFAPNVALWHEADWARDIRRLNPGECVEARLSIETLLGPMSGAISEIHTDAFKPQFRNGEAMTLRTGRFYPSLLCNGLVKHPEDRAKLFRTLGSPQKMVKIDTRHPLTDYALTIKVHCEKIREDGSPTPFYVVLHKLAAGPGIQARHRNIETDFSSDDAYARPEGGADPYFYALPRLTAHLDSRAQQAVGAFYREVLPEHGHLLDLMSSLHSNLDGGQSYKSLTGLGLNAEEMASNQELTNAVIADLNKGRAIPFSDCAFDGAICTVSVDYLIHPVETLSEVGRILKAGAPFAATYSNRWFPTKVTKLWTELHPFERLGLLATYLHETGCFRDLETYSIRGLPRPPDDPYSDQIAESDPIFAIAARKAI
ncbi:MAG: hypothetical protein O2912_06990 [Proteobacteria bacterium]|nr:hypothetical protein [Pseudomonadota bacterium]